MIPVQEISDDVKKAAFGDAAMPFAIQTWNMIPAKDRITVRSDEGPRYVARINGIWTRVDFNPKKTEVKSNPEPKAETTPAVA